MSIVSQSTEFAGRTLTLETGRVALQATGSVLATYGETVVLATAVIAESEREGIDFFPLLIDYEEKFYAAGKISGSRFIKREGRPSDQAVLSARLIDRPLRPLFPKDFRRDIQVVVTVLSVDKASDPAMIGTIASSTALLLAHAPFHGPVGAVRVGEVEGSLVVNPAEVTLDQSPLDLVVAGTEGKVLMLEAGASEVAEERILEAIECAQKEINAVIEFQREFVMKAGVSPSLHELVRPPIFEEVSKVAGDLRAILSEADRARKEKNLAELEQKVLSELEGNYKQLDLSSAFGELVEKTVRRLILDEDQRPDGRTLDAIRPISIEVGVLPRVHGSALFSRGETQSLTTVTLGAPGEEQVVETMMEEGVKGYMHHYNFPPFSTGEVKPIRGAGRREIGHGALAERALLAVLPSREEFPYTIRVVSEILSSNGSTSMAATCGSTLALMDAGVPIKRPVAGIAIGMVSDAKQRKLLVDIQGIEDFGGDMDFKVAGTSEGITAVQLDMKLEGIDHTVVRDALQLAREARRSILNDIQAALAAPRRELSQFAPRVTSLKVPVEKIGVVIGPSGKTIKGLVERAGGEEVTTITVEDDGTVFVSSRDAKLSQAVVDEIKALTTELEAGQIYTGEVESIVTDQRGGEIGAIVRIGPHQEGMVHISQLADWRVPDVSSILKVGDAVKVKCVEVVNGRTRFSYKEANPPLERPAHVPEFAPRVGKSAEYPRRTHRPRFGAERRPRP